MSETTKDRFDAKLDSELEALKKCQQEKNLDSCMPCEKTLECQTRQNYVKAVYESMNKGAQGDFEF